MQTIVLYHEKLGSVDVLQHAMINLEMGCTSSLTILTTLRQTESALKWSALFKKKFTEITVREMPVPSPDSGDDWETLYFSLLGRLKQIPLDDEVLVIHPSNAPSKDLWLANARDERRKGDVGIIGEGTPLENGSKLITKSFVFAKGFIAQSRARGGRYLNLMQSMAWEVRKFGDVVESLNMFTSVAEYRNTLMKVPVKVKEEKPVKKGEAAMDAIFEAKMAEPEVETPNPVAETVENGDDAPANEVVEVVKRARDEDGQFVGDDPSTPDVNEAWEGGEPPKKTPKKKAAKKAAKKTTRKRAKKKTAKKATKKVASVKEAVVEPAEQDATPTD